MTSRYTLRELADRADMTLDEVYGLIDAGVLEPTPDKTVPTTALNRVRLAHALTQDIPLEDSGCAIEAGSLHFRFVDAPFGNPVPIEPTTYGESQTLVDEAAGAGFEFEAIGEIPLKGIREPVPLYSARNRHSSTAP